MNTLFILLGSFMIATIITKRLYKRYELALSARIALSVMLLFTALGHVMFVKGMAMMIPDFIPYKTALVYLTGVFELVVGVSLLIPATRVYSGWLLIAFLLLVLPANIKASLEQVDYQNATFTGHGTRYLIFRIPLQFFFIGWTYLSCIRNFTLKKDSESANIRFEAPYREAYKRTAF
jgi:uncharacterized membrane protein